MRLLCGCYAGIMRRGTKAAGGGDVDYYRHYGVALKNPMTGNDIIQCSPQSHQAQVAFYLAAEAWQTARRATM